MEKRLTCSGVEWGKDKRSVTTDRRRGGNSLENSSLERNSHQLEVYTFFLISQHFDTRGCQEHHQIKIEDLKTIHDPVTGEITTIE